MSNNQLKKVFSVLRDSGIRCATIGCYYEKKIEFCMDIMECILVSLDHSNSRAKYHHDIKETLSILY